MSREAGRLVYHHLYFPDEEKESHRSEKLALGHLANSGKCPLGAPFAKSPPLGAS